jgi:2-methylisocitrate lyase-like PEP mutase family enzyme
VSAHDPLLARLVEQAGFEVIGQKFYKFSATTDER